MKVFVTGGHGFLGTAITKTLAAQGHELVVPGSSECDLTNQDSLFVYNNERFDQIFHLAAWTQAGDFCLTHPGEQWIINQKINTNTLSWWAKSQPQAKLIFMGTSCAYAPGSALVEEDYMNGEPVESLYTYAMTKRMLLQGARAIEQQYGLNWLCAVPSTLYGPGYHTDGRQMHFIFDLIRKILRGKYHNDPVVLWGDGHQRRELVYLDDFIRTLLKINQTESKSLINIGAGIDFSIREFAEQICSCVHFDPRLIKYDTSKYVGAKTKKLSIKKLEVMYPGYLADATSLEVGISQVVEWFRAESAY
jgi:GDP-L-fucose synthase